MKSSANIPLLAIAYGLSALATLMLSVVVGRSLGAAALGSFALAVAVVRIFYSAADFGVNAHVGRLVSRDRQRSGDVLSLFVTFRLLLIPCATLTAVVAAFGYHDPELAMFGLVAIAVGLLMTQGVYEAVLLAHDQARVAAALNTVASVCIAIACGTWFVLHGSLLALGIAYALAAAATLATWTFVMRARFQLVARWQLDRRRLASELFRSWPIGVSQLLAMAALRCPILVLRSFGTASDVGAYSAADMFVTASAILQVAITNTVYPRLASTFRSDPRAFRGLFWRSNIALAAVGIALAAGFALFGPWAIGVVFPGSDFTRVTELAPIIGWSTPALLLVHHNVLVFAAADHERLNLSLMACWLAAITASELAFVPAHGAIGAAWGILLGRTLGLAVVVLAVLVTGFHRGERRVTELARSRSDSV